MNIQNKTENFKKMVLKEAEKERDRILNEVESLLKERSQGDENAALNEAYKSIQAAVAASDKYKNGVVSKAHEETSKKLLTRRDEIISEIFDLVLKKLLDFSETSEYKDWLLKRLEKALSLSNGNPVTAYVTNKDLRFRDALIENGAQNVLESSQDILGGAVFIIENKGIIANYSFKLALIEAKEGFHEIKITD